MRSRWVVGGDRCTSLWLLFPFLLSSFLYFTVHSAVSHETHRPPVPTMPTSDDHREETYRIDSSLFDLANRKGDYIKDLTRTATACYVSRLTLLQKRFIQCCSPGHLVDQPADLHRFCLSAQLPSFDPTLPFSPPPTAYTIEAFLRSLARGLRGRLDPNGKITLNTLTTCWRELRHVLKVETGYVVPPDIKARIDSVRGAVEIKYDMLTPARRSRGTSGVQSASPPKLARSSQPDLR